MNIDNFLQNISNHGLASSNKFEVDITLPLIMRVGNITMNPIISKFLTGSDFIRYRADAVIVPGVSFLTVDTNRHGVGTRVKQPYNEVSSDIQVQFIADADGYLESFFNIWFNFCFNSSQDINSQTASYYANYRDDIVANIDIYKYDDANNIINVYNISRAMPTIITPIRMSWDARNAKMKFIVNFHYTNFSIASQIDNPLSQ
jgi:hypothetical protein